MKTYQIVASAAAAADNAQNVQFAGAATVRQIFASIVAVPTSAASVAYGTVELSTVPYDQSSQNDAVGPVATMFVAVPANAGAKAENVVIPASFAVPAGGRVYVNFSGYTNMASITLNAQIITG